MSILYDQLYTSHVQIPQSASSKAFQHTTMYQAANGSSDMSTRTSTSDKTSNSTKTSTSKADSDSASMMSYSSTASTIALIKNKFTTSSKKSKKEELSPREKQVEKSKGRTSNATLATFMAMR